jgi:hypothetical protein
MFAFKPLSLALAAVALSLGSVSAVLTASPGEAAIVSGQFSGTWQLDYTGTNPLNFSPGDAFTAAYTYDDTQVFNSDFSVPGETVNLYAYAPLLSLVLTSGSSSYNFDFTQGFGYVSSLYYSLAPSGGLYNSTRQVLQASDQVGPTSHYFFGISESGQDDFGQPFTYSGASANALTVLNDASTDDLSVSGAVPTPGATPVPTPALLPGLVGLGMAAWRKRQQAAAAVE